MDDVVIAGSLVELGEVVVVEGVGGADTMGVTMGLVGGTTSDEGAADAVCVADVVGVVDVAGVADAVGVASDPVVK